MFYGTKFRDFQVHIFARVNHVRDRRSAKSVGYMSKIQEEQKVDEGMLKIRAEHTGD